MIFARRNWTLLFLVPFLLLGGCKGKDDPLAPYRELVNYIGHTTESEETIITDDPLILVPIFEILHRGGEWIQITPKGFGASGDFRQEDDYAGRHWIVHIPPSEKLRGKGRFTCIRKIDKPIPYGSLSFELLAAKEFPNVGLKVLHYYAGDKSDFENALDNASIEAMLPNRFEPMDHPHPIQDDLAHSLRRTLNHLSENLDPDRGFIPYFNIDLTTGEAKVSHAPWDWCDISARYVRAAYILSEQIGPPNREKAMLLLERTLLQSIKKDGLAYRSQSDFSAVEADIFDQGSVLLYLVEMHRRGRDGVKPLIEKMIETLLARATKTARGLRYQYPTVLPDGTPGLAPDNWGQADPCHHGGRLLYPLALYLELEPKSKSAIGLFNGIQRYIQEESMVFSPGGEFSGHTHSRTNTLLGMVIRAQQIGDEKSLAFAKRSVDWLISGTPNWGWIPEFLPMGEKNDVRTMRAETDALADLIRILLRFAEDYPGYWQTLEKYAVNGMRWAKFSEKENHSYDRAKGAYCGFCELNGFGDRTMSCCSPAGALALLELRENFARSKGNTMTVNLALNTENELLRSDIKRDGRRLFLRFRTKKSTDLRVRIPASSTFEAASDSTAKQEDNFVVFEKLDSGDQAGITLSLEKHKERVYMNMQWYEYYWMGPFVDRINPPARRFPYLREKEY